MKTLATGSDSFTMEQDFKVRFNTQIPTTENHKTVLHHFVVLIYL